MQYLVFFLYHVYVAVFFQLKKNEIRCFGVGGADDDDDGVDVPVGNCG